MQFYRPNDRDADGNPILYNSAAEAGLIKNNWDITRFVKKGSYYSYKSASANMVLSPDGRTIISTDISYAGNSRFLLYKMLPFKASTFAPAVVPGIQNYFMSDWGNLPTSFCATAGQTVYVKPDGQTFYCSDDGRNSYSRINQWNNVDAWRYPVTNTPDAYIDLSAQISGGYGIWGIQFKPDGSKMFVIGTDGGWTNTVFQYSLSTPWLVSTATYDSLSVPMYYTCDKNMFITPDGLHMIIARNDGTLFNFTMANAWDLTGFTGNPYTTFNTGATSQWGEGDYTFAFNEACNKLYIWCSSGTGSSLLEYWEYVG